MGNEKYDSMFRRQVQAVIDARTESERLKAQYDQAFTAFKTSVADIIGKREEVGTVLGVEESKLRELAVMAFAETHDKAVFPGVGIREVTKLEYKPEDAMTWAKEHGIALALDVKAFEKIVKASPLPFVTITQEAQAMIATKLELREQ